MCIRVFQDKIAYFLLSLWLEVDVAICNQVTADKFPRREMLCPLRSTPRSEISGGSMSPHSSLIEIVVVLQGVLFTYRSPKVALSSSCSTSVHMWAAFCSVTGHWVSLSKKCLFISFAHFFIWVVCLFPYQFVCLLHYTIMSTTLYSYMLYSYICVVFSFLRYVINWNNNF